MPVRGIEQVKRKYKVTIDNICDRKTYAAIYSILSQGGAIAQTMTPIDTSTLINSQYAPQITISGAKASGNIGYTAAYAYAVHEKTGVLMGQPRANGNGVYWGPNAEPQFLKKGFEELKPSIPALLKAAYNVR